MTPKFQKNSTFTFYFLISRFYFLFSIFCVSILLSTFYFLFSYAQSAQAATLYLIPQSQTIYLKDPFLVEVRLSTEGEEINVVEAKLELPSDLLEVENFSTGGSILTLWIKEPQFEKGEISLIGGVPKGFKGDGLIARINFLTKEIGKAEVNFQEDSKVLLNDGMGTRAKVSFLEGNYEIVPLPEKLLQISSRTHPDQNKWHRGATLHLRWDLIEGVEYSFILSRNPLAEPDDIPDIPVGELLWMGDIEYPDLEDGIYYFHLRQATSDKQQATSNKQEELIWGPKVTFRAMIDSTPPEDFKPEIGRDSTIFDGKYFLSFATIDKTSGVDHYEILETRNQKIESRIWKIGESPYLLEDQSLKSTIRVKAVDGAGNERIAEIIPPEEPFPYLMVILVLIGLVVVVLVIWWIIRKKKIESRK